MTSRRDVRADQEATARLISDPSARTGAADTEPNWLGHKQGSAGIDRDLLDGATMAQLLSHRETEDAVERHIYHLRKDHGLHVERGGVLRFSRTHLGFAENPAPTFITSAQVANSLSESPAHDRRIWTRQEVERYTRDKFGPAHAAVLSDLADWSDAQEGRLVWDQTPYESPVYTYSTPRGGKPKFWAFWPSQKKIEMFFRRRPRFTPARGG